jgi:transposase-like protein
MRQKSGPQKEPATQVVKNIRRATRRHFSAEDKIRIVLEGLRGGVQNLYYRWSKEFLEAGKHCWAGAARLRPPGAHFQKDAPPGLPVDRTRGAENAVDTLTLQSCNNKPEPLGTALSSLTRPTVHENSRINAQSAQYPPNIHICVCRA